MSELWGENLSLQEVQKIIEQVSVLLWFHRTVRWRRMGRVFVKLRVMPSDVDVDLNRVKDEIARIKISDVEIKDMAIKPIAFGLKAIAVLAVMSDAEGVVDSFIAEIGKIEGVESVEVEDMELL
jgi:elongation factor 1-beta